MATSDERLHSCRSCWGPAFGGIGDPIPYRQGDFRCRRCSRDPEHRTVDALSERSSAADCPGPGSPMMLNWCPDNEPTHPSGSDQSSPGWADQMACDRGTSPHVTPVPRPGPGCGRRRPSWSSRRSHRAVTVGRSPPERSHGHSLPNAAGCRRWGIQVADRRGTKKRTEACRAAETSSARRSIDRAGPSTGASANPDRAGPNGRQATTGRGATDQLASRP